MLSMSFISRELYIHTVLRFQSRTFNSSVFTAQHKSYTLSQNICIKDIFCRSGSFLNFTLKQFSKGSQGLSGIASVSLFSFCDWSCKFCATIAANQMRKQKQLRLGHSRFPVLRATCLFRLLVLLSFALIGSCKYGTVRGYTKNTSLHEEKYSPHAMNTHDFWRVNFRNKLLYSGDKMNKWLLILKIAGKEIHLVREWQF